ncbi:glycosyltransferase family 4 protein [Vibrio cyclitrophicus]|uniref:glycosyltransferase family 4 protein n=1 Tax=Vibrio cyclitrophicus TaxID=47951 RepID=UPI003999D50D
MRIMQICYCFPPSFSGYGKQLSTVNKAFVRQRKDASILLITAYRTEISGKNYHSCSLFPFLRPKNKFLEKISFYVFCALLPILILKNKNKLDLLHIIKAGPEAAIGVTLAKLISVPVIIKIAQDEIDYDLESISFLRRSRIKILRKADFFISLSRKISLNLERLGILNNKVVSIANSVDATRFVFENKKITLRKELYPEFFDRKIYTFVGSICKRKGVEDFLNALSIIDNKFPIHVNLIGPNYNDISDFEKKVEQIKARENITIDVIGKVEDAVPFIYSSDYFVLPSYSEGMPNVVLEALSCGIPVIVSDIPVCREIVNDTNGIIFETSNVDSLAKAILDIDLINWDEIVISQSALLNYSSDVISEKYYALYKRAINGGK